MVGPTLIHGDAFMASLANKTALVTGASRGIGRATAEALATVGAHLIVHYGRAAAEADALVAGIRAAGGSADAAQADLSMPEGAAALAKQVRAIVGQRLDIFVSNAGVSKAAAIEEHTIEDFDNLFATNVRSPFFLVKELLPLFREGSSIIVVSSLAARAAPGNPGQPGAPSLPAYAATKGALETLVKHWAAMLGPRGIRVNAVAPGVIETDMSEWHQNAGKFKRPKVLRKSGPSCTMVFFLITMAQEAPRCIAGFLPLSTLSGKTLPPSLRTTSSTPPAARPDTLGARAVC
jgi:3-oxoacyl-[acyl-carrier protein] reductase